MRKTLTAAALVLALGCPALAGEMHTPVVTPPPQPLVSAEQEPTQEPTADGIIQNGITGNLTETVLDLLAGVLTLV